MDWRLGRLLFGLLLGAVALLRSGLLAQTEISPYASEAELGKLIGKQVRVDGVFHRDAFSAPAVAISGRVFLLLENPPNKRTFKFPVDSRFAVVTGTLYLYDGNQQNHQAYERFGKRYYFFNVDTSKIEFGKPLKGGGGAEAKTE